MRRLPKNIRYEDYYDFFNLELYYPFDEPNAQLHLEVIDLIVNRIDFMIDQNLEERTDFRVRNDKLANQQGIKNEIYSFIKNELESLIWEILPDKVDVSATYQVHEIFPPKDYIKKVLGVEYKDHHIIIVPIRVEDIERFYFEKVSVFVEALTIRPPEFSKFRQNKVNEETAEVYYRMIEDYWDVVSKQGNKNIKSTIKEILSELGITIKQREKIKYGSEYELKDRVASKLAKSWGDWFSKNKHMGRAKLKSILRDAIN